LLALAGCLILFSALVENLLARGWWFALDSRVLELMAGPVHPAWSALWSFLTVCGGRLAIIALMVFMAAYLCLRRQWRHLFVFAVAYGSGEGVMLTLKAIYHRARPPAPLISVQGSGFPSGNAFTAMLLCSLLIYLIGAQATGKGFRWAISAVGGFLVLAVGVNRLYLRAHWLSDVLAGYLLGFAWLLVVIILVQALWPVRETPAPPLSSPPEG
jgi:undecaprenyl-diphosphatase